jgi:hypothetical protein
MQLCYDQQLNMERNILKLSKHKFCKNSEHMNNMENEGNIVNEELYSDLELTFELYLEHIDYSFRWNYHAWSITEGFCFGCC